MERLKITLSNEEYTALIRMCERELRPLPDQARLIIRERLRHEGLLGDEVKPLEIKCLGE